MFSRRSRRQSNSEPLAGPQQFHSLAIGHSHKGLLNGGFAISDTDTARAMAAAFRYLKIVVEPGGAVALAAVLTGAYDCRDKTVCVICSGGNVDGGVFAEAIGHGDGL